MTQSTPEVPATYGEQIALLRNSTGWRRLLAYLGLVYLATPFLLGFIFLMMLMPLTLALARLATIYTPAYRLVGRMLGVQHLPERLAPPSLLLIGYSIVYILFWLVVASVCARLLFYSGFCNQNVVCLAGTQLFFKQPAPIVWRSLCP